MLTDRDIESTPRFKQLIRESSTVVPEIGAVEWQIFLAFAQNAKLATFFALKSVEKFNRYGLVAYGPSTKRIEAGERCAEDAWPLIEIEASQKGYFGVLQDHIDLLHGLAERVWGVGLVLLVKYRDERDVLHTAHCGMIADETKDWIH